VAALTQGTGRRRWRDQIPGEGHHSDGGDGQKGNRGGVAHGVLQREDRGGERTGRSSVGRPHF
jgi:hypothetical protein